MPVVSTSYKMVKIKALRQSSIQKQEVFLSGKRKRKKQPTMSQRILNKKKPYFATIDGKQH